MVLLAGVASAADVRTQPQIDLRLEQNDNFGLVPGGSPESDIYGYIADAVWLIDMATPRSDTLLRPRIKFQDFPDRDQMQRFEGFLDMNSQYRWERGKFEIIGHVSHEDLYNNETVGGDFDPTDPNAGGGSDAGNLVVGETRNEIEARPSFEFRVSERTNLGFGVAYQATRYDADQGATSKTDFDYSQANTYLSWALSPTSDFSTGIYASRYEATDNSEKTDARGVDIGFVHRWSEQVGLETALFYEENDITEFDPVLFKETTSDFGGDVTAYFRGQVSEWRFSVGRAFVPTGDGGKSTIDQLRLQYERQLSQRLTFRGVGRYETRNSLGGTAGGVDRDFARTDLSLKWLITQNWYLGGGYTYMWEDRASATQTGDNNRFFINFGYQGLPLNVRQAPSTQGVSKP
jgi:hypothetical protein